ANKDTHYCLNCHAADPSGFAPPRYAPPKIVGQNAAYLIAALNDYRDGRRNHYLMQSPAETIARDTIAEVAEYLSKLDGTGLPEYPTAEPDLELAARGAELAGHLCVECHHADPARNKDAVPILNGQHPSYLTAAIRDYRLGVRRNKRMGDAVVGLSQEEVRAIVAYYAQLDGLYPWTGPRATP
ncbi:MAG: c-type cytochrome, partial [Rhodospirillaceae bacterium]|nr:c-type cytochrome [Rhodospirillaceae bacterium]